MKGRLLSFADKRWESGSVESLPGLEDDEPHGHSPTLSAPPFTADVRCSACGVTVSEGEQHSAVATHYLSDWHKYNARRALHGKQPITEEDFEQKISDQEDFSEGGTESDEECDEGFLREKVRRYFVHGGEVFSMYRCVLCDRQRPSRSFFARPLNCAIFLLAGGHFSGGIFNDDELVISKSFHRYTVRAKQGGAQSAADASGKKAKSAGASLRRYNEKMLKEEIQELITSWAAFLTNTPLVFIRSPTYNRCVFMSDSTNSAPFLKSDSRLRSIPFATRRPTIDELHRTWKSLKAIHEHGTVDEFRKRYLERKSVLKKKKIGARRKANVVVVEEFSDDDGDDADTSKAPRLPKIPIRPAAPQTEVRSGEGEEGVEFGEVSIAERRMLYTAVRSNSEAGLMRLLEEVGDRRADLERYLIAVRYPPDLASALHVAAKREAVNIIPVLLSLGCDPSVKDASGLVPYQVSANRPIRRAFSEFRMENEEMFDWNKSQIPELVVPSEEKLARDAEKKVRLKERKKLREKAKKEERRVEKANQEAQAAYLALSDREKRALAAERRLASSLQERVPVVAHDGNRCFQCGVVLPAKPFEYSANRFCSIVCLQQHRREHPQPQVVI